MVSFAFCIISKLSIKKNEKTFNNSNFSNSKLNYGIYSLINIIICLKHFLNIFLWKNLDLKIFVWDIYTEDMVEEKEEIVFYQNLVATTKADPDFEIVS